MDVQDGQYKMNSAVAPLMQVHTVGSAIGTDTGNKTNERYVATMAGLPRNVSRPGFSSFSITCQ